MARDTLLTLLAICALFASALALALWPVLVETFRRAGQVADSLGVPRPERERP